MIYHRQKLLLDDISHSISMDKRHWDKVFNFGNFSIGDKGDTVFKDGEHVGALEWGTSHYSPDESMMDEWEGYDRSNPLANIYYFYMYMDPDSRGENYMAQQSIRFEDYLRKATDHLPEELKRNVTIGLDAGLDVGKYYHATQGFRYGNNDSRMRHLESMKDSLLSALGVETGVPEEFII